MRKSLWFFLCFFAAQPAFSKCLNCNVILISLDTVGAKHVSAYGADQTTTPNIDAFAKKSRLYANAYSVAPWTLPSHAAMLTGQYPWAMGVYSQDQRLPASVPTLAQLLKAKGYKTAAITGGLYVAPYFGFNAGFDDFKISSENNSYEKTFTRAVDGATQWITQNKKAPFFFFLHTYDVHSPYLPTLASVKAMGGDGSVLGITTDELMKNMKEKLNTPAEQKRVRMLYRAGLHDVDRNLGRLLKSIESQGLLQNTIVIITSDHGDELGEHGYIGAHGFTLYEEVLRVPLIVSIPNKPAKKLKSLVSLVDIVPTVLSNLDIAWPTSMQGQVLPEVDASSDRRVFAISTFSVEEFIKSFERKVPAPSQFNRYAVISSKDKYILDTGTKSNSVYDLVRDPKEKSPKALKCADPVCLMQSQFIYRSGAVK